LAEGIPEEGGFCTQHRDLVLCSLGGSRRVAQLRLQPAVVRARQQQIRLEARARQLGVCLGGLNPGASVLLLCWLQLWLLLLSRLLSWLRLGHRQPRWLLLLLLLQHQLLPLLN
jgi:hypothetical protein